MTLPIWKKLIALVEIDNQMSSLDEQVNKIKKQVAEDLAKLNSFERGLNSKKAELKDKLKGSDFVELKLQEVDSKEVEKKKNLDSVKDQKSYEALQRELSILNQDRQVHEELLVKAWNEIEFLEKKIKFDITAFEERKKNFEESFVSLKQQEDVLTNKQKELLEKRAEKEKEILPQWLSRYNQMKQKVANPIVKIANASCSACFYMLLPQDNAKILKGEILPCRNCYRLLYFDAQEAEEPVF